MINNFEQYLTYGNIYLIANWAVIPFWILLVAMPQHTITRFFAHSIIAPLLLGTAYVFITYEIFLEDVYFEPFNLYLGLDELYSVFSNELFLLVFWLHFLSLSLFVGSWIARDSLKYFIPRFLTFFCLITTYFAGPIGIIFYWFIRVFYSKKINFND
jgi:hypothetical protein